MMKIPAEENETLKAPAEEICKDTGIPAAPALNPEQEYAVRCNAPHIAVIAGPGTGKTKRGFW